MNPKQAAVLNIAISFIFAMAIVCADFLLEGIKYNGTVMYILIAMWFVPFSFLSITGRKKGRKWRLGTEHRTSSTVQ